MTTPTTNGKGGPGRIPPPLPLVPEVFKTLEREEALGFKIFSIPGDNDAPKISVESALSMGRSCYANASPSSGRLKRLRKGATLTITLSIMSYLSVC
jgi:hypothetical protein